MDFSPLAGASRSDSEAYVSLMEMNAIFGTAFALILGLRFSLDSMGIEIASVSLPATFVGMGLFMCLPPALGMYIVSRNHTEVGVSLLSGFFLGFVAIGGVVSLLSYGIVEVAGTVGIAYFVTVALSAGLASRFAGYTLAVQFSEIKNI